MTCGSALDDVCCVFNFFQPCIDDMALHMQACLSSNEFSANGAGIGLIRNCSAALVPVLADKMEQLFQCVVMPTYAMSESRSDCRKICLKESQVEKYLEIYMKYQLLKIWRRYLTNFQVATEVCPLLQIPCHQIWEYCAVWGKLRGLKWFYDMKRTIQNPNKAPSQQQDIWKSYEISWNRKSHVSLYLNSNQRSLKLSPNWGEEAEICVKGACVTKGYATWQWNVKVQSAECREVNLMNVYESATSIATKEMRAHMDQDPNIEAFTTDGWLRTGDKGCLLRAGRTWKNFFWSKFNTPQQYLQWDYETTNYPQFGKGSIDRNGMMMHDVRLHRWKQLLMPVWTLQRDYQSWWAQACLNICLDNTAKEMQETYWQAAFWLNGCKQRNSVSCSMMDEKLRWWREDLTLWGSRREAGNYGKHKEKQGKDGKRDRFKIE